ncbi:glycoside hydrolase family protein [Croceivirga sp. JEA036]|uniref:glycoside hydrolase family protein n=1 Tax=Croceivirga sp. JEA036 TaxID=2721162 RepID=UPI00143A2089|nr:glycoside hydrolase family protein [Croceivirga sp. JEA036]NJB37775.1 sucrase [Croceivirga sp. JEA036]
MKNLINVLSIVFLIFFGACRETEKEDVKANEKVSVDYKISFGKVAKTAIFRNDSLSIWGGSLVKGDDNRYHMLYARWPKKIGWEWVTYSEIAHAVAPTPYGPFKHKSVVLPDRGKEYWDGSCTHNPTVHKFNGKYYLYYMGNTGDKKIVSEPGKPALNWEHRNKQRIGVAVADSPEGPWLRMDEPVLDVGNKETDHDALMTSNPSVCQMPDGKILMVYKAVGKQFDLPAGGPVVHMVAIGDSPTGPFKKYPDPVFTFEGERFPAEDPYIWYQDGRYRAIVKRMKHVNGERLFSLVHYDSKDGIHWDKATFFNISERKITWEDGREQQFVHLERPQVFVEDGRPVALLCAADTLNAAGARESFNLQIPLHIEKIIGK